jgi:hypothetical protein
MKSGMERIGRTVTLEVAKRSCLDKKSFPSRNDARDAAAKNGKRFGPAAAKYWYRCTLCSGWHLTSSPPRSLQQNNVRKGA